TKSSCASSIATWPITKRSARSGSSQLRFHRIATNSLTLKLRRKIVLEHYRRDVESMYDGS
ncbi:MAG: hypothetical protein ACLQU2_03275, partial [Candidatus Binataceae bacterium]